MHAKGLAMLLLKRQAYRIMAVILFILLTVGCTSSQNEVVIPINFTEAYLVDDMSMLSIGTKQEISQARLWYFSPYTSIIPDVTISSGLYPSSGELLAAHVFEGKEVSQGTIIMIYGYSGHPLFTHFQYFAQQMVKRGYRAIVLDLPGHGFSGGPRGDITNFRNYGDMIKDFLEYTKGTLGDQVILMGHSTGAVAIYESYVQYPEVRDQITSTILLAPFIDLKNSGVYSIGANLVKDINSVSIGPMMLYRKPSLWIWKQREWTKEAREYETIAKKMLVVFGREDQIIKLPESQLFFQDKISHLEVLTFNLDHSFAGQGYDEFRKKTLAWLLEDLK